MTDRSGLPRLAFLGALVGSTWVAVAFGGQLLSDWLFLVSGLTAVVTSHKTAPVPAVRHVAAPLFAVASGLVILGCLLVGGRERGWSDLTIAANLAASLCMFPLLVLWASTTSRHIEEAIVALGASLSISGAVGGLAALGFDVTGYQRAWEQSHPFSQRFVGLSGHPNIMGFGAALLVPILVGARSRLSMHIGRFGVAALLAGTILALILSASRGAVLGALLGMFALLLTGGLRKGALVRVLLVGGILGTIVLPGSALWARLTGDAGSRQSDTQRGANLREAVRALRSEFPGGAGLNHLSTVHSGFLAIVVSGGLALALLLATWIACLVRADRRGRGRGERIKSLHASLVAGCVGGAAYLATSPLIYHRYAVAIFALPVAAAWAPTRHHEHKAPLDPAIERRQLAAGERPRHGATSAPE